MISLLLALAVVQAEPSEYYVPETACYASTPLEWAHEDGGQQIGLAGEILRPAGAGPRPTVLMITGSGDHVRQQMISGSAMFSMIADALVRAGFNAVLADPRGFGESTVDGEALDGPQWLQIPSSIRYRDNRHIIDDLLARDAVSDLIVLGHSEGAMITARLAADDDRIAAVVLLGDSTLPGSDVFARQRADFMVREGVDPAIAARTRPALRAFADFVASDARADDTEFARVSEAMMTAQSGLDEPFYDADLLDFYRNGSAWYREYFGYDPSADLSRLTTPVLAVWGGHDDATPPARHVPALTAALSRAGNSDHEIHILPNQDHFFLEFEGERVDRHPYGRVRIAPELTRVLVDSLTRRFGETGYCSD
ncbi:alpha/beta hydrolase family protein [Hyphobacterium marinum]|uniref:Alpha/beta hydrolase n=1 Tax=Hyphobacterium marinum TaxID=3116574 RepID=A0ABU7LX85_9PROT|nr:alpha/beta hydrolase [Hyphobacterium sp. Y6023]MEE2566135.1 alpha/beta hydrolase [Hyphobacterium sp. Y6023]